MIFTVTPNPVLDRTLTVPTIVYNEMVRATDSRLDLGGKGFNVSRAVGAVGIESVAMGFVGGAAGQQLLHGLQEMEIATDLVPIKGETRTNIVITQADAKRYIKVNEAGPDVQVEDAVALLQRVRKRVHPGDIWVFSGSLPPGVPNDYYAQLVGIVKEHGAKALLDASGIPLRLGCAAGPYLVKPNTTEAREITGREIRNESDALFAVDLFLARGIEQVALSLGADGLLLVSSLEGVWARPPQVQARNPVGAGDALLAGIAWALQRELPLQEIARWGVAMGTAAAMCEGVSVGSRDQVRELYEQVRLEVVRRRA